MENMKVKVLNYLDADNGKIMNTFVLKEEANLEEITKTVEEVFQNEEGQRPYITIIYELYGHLLIDVLESKEYNW